MTRFFRVSAGLAMFVAVFSVGSIASAGPIIVLGVDFNLESSPTQSGFSPFASSSSGTLGSRNFDYSGLSLAYTQTGTVNIKLEVDANELIQARDRSAPADAGAFTQGNLYRDFAQHNAANRYLDILFTGLKPNQPYDVKFWAYDNAVTNQSNKLNFIDYTSGSAGASGYIQWGAGAVTANDQYTIMFSGTSSATGTMKYQAHVFTTAEDPDGPNGTNSLTIGTQTQAKLNALQIMTVPEPSSIVMFGFAVLAIVFHRRRFAVQAITSVQR